MTITKKMFWNQALTGGTIIGLAMIFLAALRLIIAPTGIAGTLFSLLNLVVFAALVWYFTSRLAKKADTATGFSFGNGVGFSVAMMLFVGLLMGIYTWVLNNYIAPHRVDEAVEAAGSMIRGMGAYGDPDSMITMMRNMQTNLLFLVFSNIIGYVIYGLIVGLITSAIAKRNPDTLARYEDDDDE